MKSALIAYRVAWEITRDPTLRVLFISSTSNLATKQLKFIKDILTSDNYRAYWPEMVNKDEARREKWTEREISIDHPMRREESIRDPTIFTAGLTSNIVGMHCDIAVLDDVVVQANAYTEDGREKVKDQYSLLSSVETANSKEWVVGTRYHPNDLYSDLMNMEIEEYDELGNVIQSIPLFEKMEESVESVGDGTGEYLWPRQQRADGKWFGFDQEILAKKRAQYLNKIHFRAQYYNDPHDVDSSAFKRDLFQYYDPGFLSSRDGRWFFKGERINIVAAVDFAFTAHKKSDYTAIVVLGLDGRGNYYILEIDRFKTEKISEYFDHILKMYNKWGFRKIRTEVTAAQQTIVNDLKDNYIRPLGLSLAVDEYRPSRFMGAKEERILAALEPKYANKQIWHYRSGNCQVLEEELLFANPIHDDVKDALAAAVDFAYGQAPLNSFMLQKSSVPTFTYHSKFGGVA
jgi:phage terminase large subunit-like protein